jgi:glycosyltransferase involved in cell wall biosynthesis
VDEFVVVVGKSNDDTLARIHAIGSPKIRVIETIWNERMADRGFVYAQQKMIAQYACTGDWAFYLEGDELVHQTELANIRASVDQHHANPSVEALVFDYFHFYGTPDFVANSPAWYRRECRLIRNTIRSYAPDGQYWLITANHKKGRNPQAALANAHIYHYGWVRSNEAMQKKMEQVSKFWSHGAPTIRYSQFDGQVLQPFTGTHPELIKPWLESSAEKSFTIDPDYQLSKREKRHRWLMKLEKAFGLDFSRKHFKLVT